MTRPSDSESAKTSANRSFKRVFELGPARRLLAVHLPLCKDRKVPVSLKSASTLSDLRCMFSGRLVGHDETQRQRRGKGHWFVPPKQQGSSVRDLSLERIPGIPGDSRDSIPGYRNPSPPSRACRTRRARKRCLILSRTPFPRYWSLILKSRFAYQNEMRRKCDLCEPYTT